MSHHFVVVCSVLEDLNRGQTTRITTGHHTTLTCPARQCLVVRAEWCIGHGLSQEQQCRRSTSSCVRFVHAIIFQTALQSQFSHGFGLKRHNITRTRSRFRLNAQHNTATPLHGTRLLLLPPHLPGTGVIHNAGPAQHILFRMRAHASQTLRMRTLALLLGACCVAPASAADCSYTANDVETKAKDLDSDNKKVSEDISGKCEFNYVAETDGTTCNKWCAKFTRGVCLDAYDNDGSDKCQTQSHGCNSEKNDQCCVCSGTHVLGPLSLSAVPLEFSCAHSFEHLAFSSFLVLSSWVLLSSLQVQRERELLCGQRRQRCWVSGLAMCMAKGASASASSSCNTVLPVVSRQSFPAGWR